MLERLCPGGCHPPLLYPGRRNRVLSRWRVFAGAVAQASPHGLQMGVQAVVYHRGYLPFRDPNSEENSNDIALVHLSSPLPFTGKSEPWPGDARGCGDRAEARGLGVHGVKGHALEQTQLGVHQIEMMDSAALETSGSGLRGETWSCHMAQRFHPRRCAPKK